ncbi:MAG: site-specific DNA-methyltransferase [Actinobacteria bacterium]|nr:MAG: site-specific DNA-methyltransferase [Actinomycetota bacterium]
MRLRQPAPGRAGASGSANRPGVGVQARLRARRGGAGGRRRHSGARGPRSPGSAVELRRGVAPTQDALYRDIDLELSWSERDLPERERTKHVHRLHPYLGKFIPQLVEALLARYLRPGGHVLDPFAGSGTTLVQALESGHDACGADLAAFNCLLMRVKTRDYNPFVLESELRDASARLEEFDGRRPEGEVPKYVRDWFAPQAAAELLFFRGLVDDYEHADVLRVVLARAARSARRTTHFDLDFPRAPQRTEYWCHKHRRTCRPVGEARRFLRRYALDTLKRVREFARVRVRGREATTTSSTGTPTSCSGSRTSARWSWGRGRTEPHWPPTSRASRRCWRTCADRCGVAPVS